MENNEKERSVAYQLRNLPGDIRIKKECQDFIRRYNRAIDREGDDELYLMQLMTNNNEETEISKTEIISFLEKKLKEFRLNTDTFETSQRRDIADFIKYLEQTNSWDKTSSAAPGAERA